MVTQNENGMQRVTVTLEPEDVRLLDALARFEGQNRSSELRSLLVQIRPMMQQLVATFTVFEQQREQLDEMVSNATASELQSILPEAEEMNRRFIGMMAKLEGAIAVTSSENGPEAPASNTGATND